jgi:hypothetical protein
LGRFIKPIPKIHKGSEESCRKEPVSPRISQTDLTWNPFSEENFTNLPVNQPYREGTTNS